MEFSCKAALAVANGVAFRPIEPEVHQFEIGNDIV